VQPGRAAASISFVLTIAGWRRGVLAAIVAAALPVGLVGCSSGGKGGATTPANLPAAAGLLKASSQAMQDVKSAKFQLSGKGSIAGVEVDSASGTVTSDGKAQGTVKILQNGSLAELDLIVIGSDIYLKGPTGTYQKIPAALAGGVFDPSLILSPDRGLAKLEQFATNAKTVGEETVNGVDAYKVTADLDGTLVSHLMPMAAQNTVPGTLWIAKDGDQLVQITVTTQQAGGKTADLTLGLSDFGVQTNITPPA
jgi:lipoprotein LprG